MTTNSTFFMNRARPESDRPICGLRQQWKRLLWPVLAFDSFVWVLMSEESDEMKIVIFKKLCGLWIQNTLYL